MYFTVFLDQPLKDGDYITISSAIFTGTTAAIAKAYSGGCTLTPSSITSNSIVISVANSSPAVCTLAGYQTILLNATGSALGTNPSAVTTPVVFALWTNKEAMQSNLPGWVVADTKVGLMLVTLVSGTNQAESPLYAISFTFRPNVNLGPGDWLLLASNPGVLSRGADPFALGGCALTPLVLYPWVDGYSAMMMEVTQLPNAAQCVLAAGATYTAPLTGNPVGYNPAPVGVAVYFALETSRELQSDAFSAWTTTAPGVSPLYQSPYAAVTPAPIASPYGAVTPPPIPIASPYPAASPAPTPILWYPPTPATTVQGQLPSPLLIQFIPGTSLATGSVLYLTPTPGAVFNPSTTLNIDPVMGWGFCTISSATTNAASTLAITLGTNGCFISNAAIVSFYITSGMPANPSAGTQVVFQLYTTQDSARLSNLVGYTTVAPGNPTVVWIAAVPSTIIINRVPTYIAFAFQPSTPLVGGDTITILPNPPSIWQASTAAAVVAWSNFGWCSISGVIQANSKLVVTLSANTSHTCIVARGTTATFIVTSGLNANPGFPVTFTIFTSKDNTAVNGDGYTPVPPLPENSMVPDETARKFITAKYRQTVWNIGGVRGMSSTDRYIMALAINGSDIIRSTDATYGYVSAVKGVVFPLAPTPNRDIASTQVTFQNWALETSDCALLSFPADYSGFQDMKVPMANGLVAAFLFNVDQLVASGAVGGGPVTFTVVVPGVSSGLVVYVYSADNPTPVDVTTIGGTVTYNGQFTWTIVAPHTSTFAGGIRAALSPSPIFDGAEGESSLFGLFALLVLPLWALGGFGLWKKFWDPRPYHEGPAIGGYNPSSSVMLPRTPAATYTYPPPFKYGSSLPAGLPSTPIYSTSPARPVNRDFFDPPALSRDGCSMPPPPVPYFP